jgi:hypothetical protein
MFRLLRYLFAFDVLSLLRSTDGACISASATAEALICIDLVLAIAFSNCLNGTSLNASAASYAIISNLICHFSAPPITC